MVFVQHSKVESWNIKQIDRSALFSISSPFPAGQIEVVVTNLMYGASTVGVAFEQGRTLPIPEPVPFRLTRDLVDGMGVAGVEGVFRRCCEETLKVMRNSHEELKTIVEVRSNTFCHVYECIVLI